MKTYKYLWLILLVFAFTTCKEDEPAPIASIEIKDVVIEAAYTTADIQWNITCNASMQEVILEYSTDSAFKNLQQVPMQKVHKETDDGLYQVTISSLTEETKYYARSRVVNKINSYASAAQVFETNAYRLPHVSTDSITNITVAAATLHATLLDWGTDTLPQVGFCVATHTDVTIADSSAIYYLQTMNDTIPYSFTLKNLTDNVTYYVRAFARNTKGVAYGKEMSFSTAKIFLPSVGETTISNITYTTAVCTSEILSDGGSEVIERGICYATTQNPTTANYKVASGSGIGSFSCNLTDLASATTYYVRAYAINSKGTSYGEPILFTTVAYGLPTITTSAVTNITYTSATCGGDVTSDGGQTVTERGVCYATTQNPTISNTKISSGSGTGSFSCNLTGLNEGTKYYVRAYATNSQGTSYSEEIAFTTTAYQKPTVTTSLVTNVTYTSATCGGNVTADGGQTVTERGVCYATTQNPTISDTKVTSGSGLGSFTCNLTGFSEGTKYYVRAYATNSQGTSYGEEIAFSTTAYQKPTVTTSAVTNITYTSATCGGNVTADGGQTVTERGVCYATTQNPTISDTKVTSGSGLGSFTCNLTDLTAGTKYYIRAYATNSIGTVYGNQIIFQTTMPSTPTVVTSSCSFSGGIICNGSIMSNGSDIIECGFCYSSTSSQLSIKDSHIISSMSENAIVDTITDFYLNTTYYICAYARNSKGIAYGQVVTYRTPMAPTISILNSSYYTCTNTSTNTWRAYVFISIDNPYDLPISQVGFYHESNWPTSTAPSAFFYPSYVLSHTNYHPVYCSYDAISNTYQGSGGASCGSIDINSWYAIGFYVCCGDTTTTAVVPLNKKTFYY